MVLASAHHVVVCLDHGGFGQRIRTKSCDWARIALIKRWIVKLLGNVGTDTGVRL